MKSIKIFLKTIILVGTVMVFSWSAVYAQNINGEFKITEKSERPQKSHTSSHQKKNHKTKRKNPVKSGKIKHRRAKKGRNKNQTTSSPERQNLGQENLQIR